MVKTGDLKTSEIHKANEFITDLGLKNSSAKLFPSNTVLVAMYGATIGACSILKIEASTNQACAAFLPNDSINEKYLMYFLKSQKRNFIKMGVGGAQPNISGTILKNTKIPLPPLPIQREIAARLDAADALRRKDRELLEAYDSLAQSVFLEMFGDPVKNEKGWEVRKLGTELKFLTSGSRGWAKYYSEKGDKFLRIQNVGYNRLILEDLTFVNPPDNAESKRTKVQEGDILLSITADLGRTAVIPSGFGLGFINQHLAILRISEKFNPVFLSQFLSSRSGQIQFEKLNKGGTKAGLNFNDIKSLMVPIPPKSHQEQFRSILENLEEQRLSIKKSINQSETLFQALLQESFGS